MAVIGIDLGTTNSLAVAYKEDHFEMIPNAFHEVITPSVRMAMSSSVKLPNSV